MNSNNRHIIHRSPCGTPAPMRSLLWTVLSLLITLSAGAQQQAVGRYYYLDPSNRDFASIQQVMENYYANSDQGKGSGYKQWKRWEYTQRSRLAPDGKVVNAGQWNMLDYLPYKAALDAQRSPLSAMGNWTFMGPTDFNQGYHSYSAYSPGLGRMNVVAFHPFTQMLEAIGN